MLLSHFSIMCEHYKNSALDKETTKNSALQLTNQIADFEELYSRYMTKSWNMNGTKCGKPAVNTQCDMVTRLYM